MNAIDWRLPNAWVPPEFRPFLEPLTEDTDFYLVDDYDLIAALIENACVGRRDEFVHLATRPYRSHQVWVLTASAADRLYGRFRDVIELGCA
jgi:hypothetical protein